MFDPDLDYSTYPTALAKFEIISTWDFDKHFILANKKRRDMITSAFADIMNVDFVGEFEQEYKKKLEEKKKLKE